MNDYYQILEVEPNATQEQIKAQYRLLVQVWHPDRFVSPETKAKAEERTKQINEAYGVLSNPIKRGDYDFTRRNSQGGYNYQAQSDYERTRREQEERERAEAERRQKERVEVQRREQEARAEAERRQREQVEAQRRTDEFARRQSEERVQSNGEEQSRTQKGKESEEILQLLIGLLGIMGLVFFAAVIMDLGSFIYVLKTVQTEYGSWSLEIWKVSVALPIFYLGVILLGFLPIVGPIIYHFFGNSFILYSLTALQVKSDLYVDIPLWSKPITVHQMLFVSGYLTVCVVSVWLVILAIMDGITRYGEPSTIKGQKATPNNWIMSHFPWLSKLNPNLVLGIILLIFGFIFLFTAMRR